MVTGDGHDQHETATGGSTQSVARSNIAEELSCMAGTSSPSVLLVNILGKVSKISTEISNYKSNSFLVKLDNTSGFDVRSLLYFTNIDCHFCRFAYRNERAESNGLPYSRRCGDGEYKATFCTETRFAGSNRAEAVGFFGRKNRQHVFLRRGSKAVCSISQLCGMLKNSTVTWESLCSAKFDLPFLAHTFSFR
jgi:hypothetical protein